MENDLQDLLKGTDRALIITALEALWRERMHAYCIADGIATQRGAAAPEQHAFGIGEVAHMLRRFGTPVTKLPHDDG